MNEHSDPFEEIWPLIDGVEGLLVPTTVGRNGRLFETALSLPNDAARLQLHALAYNLANFMRLALPQDI